MEYDRALDLLELGRRRVALFKEALPLRFQSDDLLLQLRFLE